MLGKMWAEVWESVWGECGGCGEVLLGCGGGKERCGGCGQVWESAWDGWESVYWGVGGSEGSCGMRYGGVGGGVEKCVGRYIREDVWRSVGRHVGECIMG